MNARAEDAIALLEVDTDGSRAFGWRHLAVVAWRVPHAAAFLGLCLFYGFLQAGASHSWALRDAWACWHWCNGGCTRNELSLRADVKSLLDREDNAEVPTMNPENLQCQITNTYCKRPVCLGGQVRCCMPFACCPKSRQEQQT